MTARAVLGVAPSVTADELRAAYRSRLRAAHPDLHGRDAGTADVVAAYRALRDLVSGGGEREPAPQVALVVAGEAVVVEGDTVVADLPAGDLFPILVAAGEAIGHVAHVDAGAGLLEVVVEVPGVGACSVVWSLGADGEAWCTAEPLGGGPAPPVDVVAALLADGLRSVTGR